MAGFARKSKILPRLSTAAAFPRVRPFLESISESGDNQRFPIIHLSETPARQIQHVSPGKRNPLPLGRCRSKSQFRPP
ncbi:hypothetical protein MM707_31550, partial [Klebsiella pneumoniae]|nr:hypothetical protein [Klebsiella pneumoniae]